VKNGRNNNIYIARSMLHSSISKRQHIDFDQKSAAAFLFPFLKIFYLLSIFQLFKN
jgi:hypothetical protein